MGPDSGVCSRKCAPGRDQTRRSLQFPSRRGSQSHGLQSSSPAIGLHPRHPCIADRCASPPQSGSDQAKETSIFSHPQDHCSAHLSTHMPYDADLQIQPGHDETCLHEAHLTGVSLSARTPCASTTSRYFPVNLPISLSLNMSRTTTCSRAHTLELEDCACLQDLCCKHCRVAYSGPMGSANRAH